MHHFLISLVDVAVIYALKAVHIYHSCMVEILYRGVHIFSSPILRDITLGGSIYDTEICKCGKSGLTL